MNFDNNNTVTARQSGDPTNADEIRVHARLLYHFLANPHLPFEEWEDSLRRMGEDLNSIVMGYRVYNDASGELTLNLKLATHFIIRSSIYPNGAVAAVLLDEALSGAGAGNADCIDRMLVKHWKVGMIPGLVQARALHAFLSCGTAFDDWFLRQKKNLRLACGRDYGRFAGTNSTQPKVFKRDNGQGEIYLGHEAAERMIMATPTPRGELASEYLRNPALRGLR